VTLAFIIFAWTVLFFLPVLFLEKGFFLVFCNEVLVAVFFFFFFFFCKKKKIVYIRDPPFINIFCYCSR
jgi:hypothetical protein